MPFYKFKPKAGSDKGVVWIEPVDVIAHEEFGGVLDFTTVSLDEHGVPANATAILRLSLNDGNGSGTVRLRIRSGDEYVVADKRYAADGLEYQDQVWVQVDEDSEFAYAAVSPGADTAFIFGSLLGYIA